jgi:hypothetical protein
MEIESEKTINIYDGKIGDNISIMSDITETTGWRNQFELIEKYNNRKKLKYIYKELSLAMFTSIIDREENINNSEFKKYTKDEKKECYIRVKYYCESVLKNNTISKLNLFPIRQNWKVPSNSPIVSLSIGTKSNKLPIFEIPKKVLKF